MIKYFFTYNKMESANIYLTLVLIGITIIAVKRLDFLNLNQEVEHFGNPIALLKKIVMGIVNFFIALLDILLVIADVFAAIPVIFFVIMDLIMIAFTWLWPISMIKGVVQSVFTITKILLLMVFDVITYILREVFKKLFGLIKGGLWGLPHTPEQHRTHAELVLGLDTQSGDHHHHPHYSDFTQTRDNSLYRPLRCYKGMGSNGYINIISTIICPPLGIFMAFGMKGWFKIAICSLLSLLYYIPGLVYALLITTHLGLGRKITAKDCGGAANYGLRLAGCTAIKTEKDCNEATIPGWRAANGDEIRACVFKRDPGAEYGGKCYNIIYPSSVQIGGAFGGHKMRQASEVGGRPTIFTDDNIDQYKELADDKEVETRKGTAIDYDPKGLAKGYDGDDKETKFIGEVMSGGEDPVPIPDGPWKYTGGT